MSVPETDVSAVCAPRSIFSNGIFEGETPFDYPVTLLTFQLAFLSIMSLSMQELLRPLGQNRYICNLVGGILLGPSFLGHFAPELLEKYLLPERGKENLMMVVEMGMRFWYLLFGAQIHIGPMMKKMTRKAALIGSSALAAPILLCYPVTFLINKLVPTTMHCTVKPVFLIMSSIMTNISVIAGNIIDHQLLDTDLGNTAMSTAIFTTIVSYFPISFLLWVVPNEGKAHDVHWRVLSGAVLIVFLCFIVRPIFNWFAQKMPNEEDVKEQHVCGVLLGALLASFVSEAIGAHRMFGVYTYGLMLPHCALTTVVTKRLEDFNTMLLMPPLFAVIGNHIHLQSMFTSPKHWTLVLILVVMYLGKVGFTALTASHYNMTKKEGLLLGVLMSSKGILDILLANWFATRKLVGEEAGEMAIIMVSIVTTNLAIGPIVSFLYKRPTLLLHLDCRSIQELKPNSELRIVGCVYDKENSLSLMNLVQATHATKTSPISLSVLHLVHTTTRDSTMQQQGFENSGFFHEHPSSSVAEAMKTHRWADHINTNLQMKLSSYSTMPDHIIHAAESVRAAMIIIPFNTRRSLSSVPSDTVRSINVSVLEKAPSSVGMFVDLCFPRVSTTFHHVVVLYFGGPDDRETLSYASRMAEQEPTRLTVVRFLPTSVVVSTNPLSSTMMTEDDLCIHRFRSTAEGKLWLTYIEKFVNCGADIISAIQGMNKIHDLFMVGRRHSPATARLFSGMEAWSDYHELGLIGDLLVSPDFLAQAVLVVQQHTWAEDYQVEGDGRESVHGLHSQGQNNCYDLHGHSNDNVPLHHRSQNLAITHQEVQFDEYGWNWNLRAGF
ncbi:unnamed protein product [Victoria cruziana]